MLLSSVVGGVIVITCREARRHWLRQLRLMNSRWHVQHYASKAARVLQELCKSCRASCYYSIVFYFGAKWQHFAQFVCKSFILFYFIANGRIALVQHIIFNGDYEVILKNHNVMLYEWRMGIRAASKSDSHVWVSPVAINWRGFVRWLAVLFSF